MNQNGQEPAAPMVDDNGHPMCWGLTKREYMAAQVMAAMYSSEETCDAPNTVLAKFAVEASEALLQALEDAS